jgi:hypothetical protein
MPSNKSSFMPVPATHHTDARDLLFADWAEAVMFREVTTTYDPAHGATAESTTDTLILAIVGPRTNTPQPNTAHLHTTHERTFLVRAEDVPPDASFATSRIVHGDDEYAILTADVAPATDVLALTTTRVTPPLAA